jgi:hypothetical protein
LTPARHEPGRGDAQGNQEQGVNDHHYVENRTDATIFVGGKMIQPGEGREIPIHLVPPSMLPPELRAQPAQAPAPTDAQAALQLLRDLQGHPVKQIVERLPDLSPEQLEQLHLLEGSSEKPRSTLLEHIRAEQLHRAQQKLQDEEAERHAAAVAAAQQELQEAQDALAAIDPENREAAEMLVAEAQAKLEALQKEED